MKKVKQMLLVLVLMLGTFGLTGCGSTTIDLNKYITIKAEGYDSMGTISCFFDTDAFVKDYGNKIKADTKYASDDAKIMIGMELEYGDVTPAEAMIDYCVNYSLDKYTDLCNGDTVMFTWDCGAADAKKIFNCELKYSDMEYEVKDLVEVGKFNPFDYVKVEFSGISPDVSAAITIDYDRPEMQYIAVKADREYGLANGEKIILTADLIGNVDEFVNNFAALPDPSEAEFAVDGFPAYVSTAADIDQDTMASMRQKAEDYFMDAYSSTNFLGGRNWGCDERDEMTAFQYVGNYFIVKNPDYAYSGLVWTNNSIYLLYKVDAIVYREYTDDPGIETSYYFVAGFKDLVLDENGACSVDLESFFLPRNVVYVATGNWIDTSFDGYASLEEAYEDLVDEMGYKGEKNLSQ